MKKGKIEKGEKETVRGKRDRGRERDWEDTKF